MRPKKFQTYDNSTIREEEPRKLITTLQTMSYEKWYVLGRLFLAAAMRTLHFESGLYE